MRSIHLVRLAAGFALLVATQLVTASGSAYATQPGAIGERPQNRLQLQPKLRRNPYGKLFEVPDLRPTTPSREPKVVCGMTMIPIDPNIDPKIRVAPQKSDTRYSIRAIPPPVCK